MLKKIVNVNKKKKKLSRKNDSKAVIEYSVLSTYIV